MPITLDAILNETAVKSFPFGSGTVVVEYFVNTSPSMRAQARERYGWSDEELKQRVESGNFDEGVISTLAARIIKWDIADAEGKEVPISEDLLKRSKDEFLISLCRTIFGSSGEDSERPTPSETS
jgi:hypothetical protein